VLEVRHNHFVAREGIPFLLATVILAGAVFQLQGALYAMLPVALFIYLFLIFRDPRREVPAVPLGVVSPTDGVVVDVGVSDKGILNRESHRIVIRVSSLGTYTARCPIEGKIMDLRGEPLDRTGEDGSNGLWVRSDEDDDVVLQFRGYRFGLAPLAFPRYGERVGQGQRCAYLRLTRHAEVQLPITSRVLVKAGQRVSAGADVLAKLPHA
jgi:phosphatidylserine decarboxylase